MEWTGGGANGSGSALGDFVMVGHGGGFEGFRDDFLFSFRILTANGDGETMSGERRATRR